MEPVFGKGFIIHNTKKTKYYGFIDDGDDFNLEQAWWSKSKLNYCKRWVTRATPIYVFHSFVELLEWFIEEENLKE